MTAIAVPRMVPMTNRNGFQASDPYVPEEIAFPVQVLKRSEHSGRLTGHKGIYQFQTGCNFPKGKEQHQYQESYGPGCYLLPFDFFQIFNSFRRQTVFIGHVHPTPSIWH